MKVEEIKVKSFEYTIWEGPNSTFNVTKTKACAVCPLATISPINQQNALNSDINVSN